MVLIGSGAHKMFGHVDQIHIADIHHQSHGYFGVMGIGNVVNNVLPNPLLVSTLQNLAVSAQEVKTI